MYMAACTFLSPIAVCAADHDCLIEARQHVDLRSPVDAVVETVQVQRGDVVKKGQVVATLESVGTGCTRPRPIARDDAGRTQGGRGAR